MKRLIKKAITSMGYELVKRPAPGADGLSSLADLDERQRKAIGAALPFTMTSPARMASLAEAVSYIHREGIAGDIAECGVWRGGSMMVVAHLLGDLGDTARELYLYDTYEGMSEPTEHDRDAEGVTAEEQLRGTPRGTGVWCEASIEDVRANLFATGYPQDQIHFVKGKVEDTIPGTLPGELALLRLDTDWYESTKHELEHLYPLLKPGGVLIIDDYGYWKGARKAVDEYLASLDEGAGFLHRIDNTGRLLIKP